MSLTYKAFTDEIRRGIFPFPGEAKSLVPAHSKFFVEAMIALQKWVPELQVNHTSVFPACSTYVQCALTVVEAPIGIIKRVYTIANDEWCDKVFLSSRSHKEVLQWQRCLMTRFTQPENAGMPALQQGFRFAEASTDSPAGRARMGIWSINRKRLHIAPWIQSNESLVVEWDGEKKEWLDTDLLDQNYWDAEVAAVVKLYVQMAHERDFGCDAQRKRQLEIDYGQKLGDLMYSWKKRTEDQANLDAEELNVCSPTADDLADDAPLAVADSTTIAFVADWSGGAGTIPVSELVKSWNPKYIVTGGDNWYDSVCTEADLDSVSSMYSEFMFPYNGTIGTGGTDTNKFFTTLGNHDRDPACHYQIHQNFFNRSRDYYDFVDGHVHWFVIDGGYKNDKVIVAQADGNSVGSVQAEYFRLKMSLSTARWKIAVLHFPPYSSRNESLFPFPALRWPIQAWGADLMLSGDDHLYERLLTPEGYPLIVAGWSGRGLHVSAAPIEYSLVQYDADFGALKITATCDEFKVEAINQAGVLVDTLTLTKP